LVLQLIADKDDGSKLVAEIDAWLNNTRDGEFVAVVAFGSVNNMGQQAWKAIIDALDFLPQMRYLLAIHDAPSRTYVTNLVKKFSSNRILIHSWIKQPHVFAHPHVRMYISHGGLYSIGEAVRHVFI
jgi:UDP:flavonoid glycosyltransferase YjiC (YdhE family)